MIYKDILYTLYELRFQGDQTPFQDSNFKKTLWVFQHLLVLLLTCSDKCALITWTVVAKNWTKKCVLQGNRISARLLTSFHLAMANLTLLHLLWGDALLTALNRLDCSRFQCSPQWSIYYAYHTKVFIMSNIYLPCSKSSLLVFVLSHNEKKSSPIPLHSSLHISGVLLHHPSIFCALSKDSSFNPSSDFVFARPLTILYSFDIFKNLCSSFNTFEMMCIHRTTRKLVRLSCTSPLSNSS